MSLKRYLAIILAVVTLCSLPVSASGTEPSEQSELVAQISAIDTTLLKENLTRSEIKSRLIDINPSLAEPMVLRDLYKEVIEIKEANDTISESPKIASRSNAGSIDEVTAKMEAEEQYVADLITDRSGAPTTTANWEYNLGYLNENYDAILSGNVDKDIVDRYIFDYNIVKNETIPDSGRRDVSPQARAAASAYDPDEAIWYAYEYAYSYNSDFPDYSGWFGDCANFVSQCLNYGGYDMTDVDGNVDNYYDNWFCYTNSDTDVSEVASTWRGATTFPLYWSEHAYTYRRFYPTDDSFDDVYNFAWYGDAVTLYNSNARAYHTMIVVDDTGDDLLLAGHTYDTDNRSLADEFGSVYGIRVYQMS